MYRLRLSKALPDLGVAWTLRPLTNPLVYNLIYQLLKAYPTHFFIERETISSILLAQCLKNIAIVSNVCLKLMQIKFQLTNLLSIVNSKHYVIQINKQKNLFSLIE